MAVDFFQWDEGLSVGNSLIDRDHQELIELVNSLHQAASDGREAALIGRILDNLLSYTQEHFQREEMLMEYINYPDQLAHKALHKKLIAQVLVLQEALNKGAHTVARDTAELLRFWLTHHIHRNDRQLAAAAKERGLDHL